MWFLFFLLLSPFTPALDLFISNCFYTAEVGFHDNLFFFILFRYGELFGLATAGVASLCFLASYLSPKWKVWRSGSLVIILTLMIGAGLITNLGFKGHWGRPRPKQTIEFGGKHSYRPYWYPKFNTKHDPQKSFPSGHVAMGFYFLSVYLVGRRHRSRLLIVSGLGLTFLLGGGLMIARVAQGGHYCSDVIAAAVLMWYIAKTIDRLTWAAPVQRFLGLKKDDIFQELDAA